MSAHKQRAPMAAVGSYESILPFKAIGLDVVVVTEENRAAVPQTLSKFSRSGYAALFLEEPLYAEFRETVDEINEYSDISIIPGAQPDRVDGRRAPVDTPQRRARGWNGHIR